MKRHMSPSTWGSKELSSAYPSTVDAKACRSLRPDATLFNDSFRVCSLRFATAIWRSRCEGKELSSCAEVSFSSNCKAGIATKMLWNWHAGFSAGNKAFPFGLFHKLGELGWTGSSQVSWVLKAVRDQHQRSFKCQALTSAIPSWFCKNSVILPTADSKACGLRPAKGWTTLPWPCPRFFAAFSNRSEVAASYFPSFIKCRPSTVWSVCLRNRMCIYMQTIASWWHFSAAKLGPPLASIAGQLQDHQKGGAWSSLPLTQNCGQAGCHSAKSLERKKNKNGYIL